MVKVAAVTMAYDEAVFMPVRARHYARQVGADQCYVVDHGSTEPLVLPAGVNVVRLPRSAHDDARRAVFISGLVASLLTYYDCVAYTDVDELLLADPSHYRDLTKYCAADGLPATVAAVGLDVQHVPTTEAGLDPRRPIGAQRHWARFSSALCKPALTRRPVNWAPGFHSCREGAEFHGLYLFHLHWADRDIGLARLHRTRRMAWQDDRHGAHQRVTDAQWLQVFDGMASLPQDLSWTEGGTTEPLAHWLKVVQDSATSGRPDLGLGPAELWRIPDRFCAHF